MNFGFGPTQPQPYSNVNNNIVRKPSFLRRNLPILITILQWIMIFVILAGFIVLLILVIDLYSKHPDDDDEYILPITAITASSTAYENINLTEINEKLLELDQRINALTLLQGPPGVCDPSDCVVQNEGRTSADSLDLQGNVEGLLPKTIASSGVALRVKNGNVEILEGGLWSKGLIFSELAVTSPSDERIKKHVQPRSALESLNGILALTPVSYNYTQDWVDHTGRQHHHEIGLIAQDLIKHYPSSVHKIKNPHLQLDDFHVINEREIITDLIGSVQYLTQYINNLEQKNNNQ